MMQQRMRMSGMSGRQSAIAWRRTMRHLVNSPQPLPSMNPANSTPPAPESCRPPVATQGGSFINISVSKLFNVPDIAKNI